MEQFSPAWLALREPYDQACRSKALARAFLNALPRNARIADDPFAQSNKRGTITFATSGVDSRTTQVFINFVDNTFLDTQNPPFTPFGRVTSGMDVVDRLYGDYGEGPSKGSGQMMIQTQGNPFLQQNFPKLDYIKNASVVQ